MQIATLVGVERKKVVCGVIVEQIERNCTWIGVIRKNVKGNGNVIQFPKIRIRAGFASGIEELSLFRTRCVLEAIKRNCTCRLVWMDIELDAVTSICIMKRYVLD